MNKKFYLVKYKYQVDDLKGPKWVKCEWLIEAYTVTEVETTLIANEDVDSDIVVESIRATKIERVIQ